MARVAIVYHSGYGHTARQAEAVARGAAGVPGVEADLLTVEEAAKDGERLARADGIAFGAPTYMGSLSAPFKAFMDGSSRAWSAGAWKDKLAAGFTNSGSHSGDKLNSLVQLAIFAAQHGMVWVPLGLKAGNNSSNGSPEDLNRAGFFLGAGAQSNVDEGPERGPTASDLRTAEHLGRRLAEASLRWNGGR